ncbi:MAG: DUF3426 domain-containing protein [Anaerolineae bacterium]|nr:DUF3426 domain-containing protein [Anaerolineae bacterium]
MVRKLLLINLFVWGTLSGCGQVLTPTPSPLVEAVASPTATATPTAPPATPQPTATPRPATPIATPTPTITPTPVIYRVQQGDTLLSIAIAFDITTEVLQAANGITDPRFLQIDQELLIPPPEPDEEAPPPPTPTPLPLVIEAINFQETGQGGLWGLGEVSNPGDVPIAEVVIEAALLDEGGLVLAREAAYTQLDVIQPGQAVPFAILFESPPSSFAQYQLIPVTGVPLAQETRYYFDLDVFDLSGAQLDVARYRLAGQLRNNGVEDAEAIRLVASLYDADDRILAQRQAELAVSRLKAGAITPFELDFTITQGVVERYEVVVQGLKVE